LSVNIFLSLLLLVSALVLVYIGYFSWKKDKLYVSISLIPVSIYAFGYAFEILCTSIEWVKFWIKVEYMGISFLPVVWLMFILNFTGYKEKIKKNTIVILYVIPITTLILNYTNDFHHLFYKKLYMNNDGIFPIVEMIQGPWYWVNIAYTYTVVVIGLTILIVAYFRAVSIIRKQIVFLIIAWVIPWISDIIYMLRLLPFDLDLCPLAFSVAGIISSYTIFKFKLLKLTPIALEKVFFNMLDGVIILDSENNIVNLNNSSRNIIPELKDIEPGDKKLHEVLKEYKEVIKAVNNNSYNENLITIKIKGQLRYYKMNINNIYDAALEVIGKILIFNEITQQKENEEKIDKLLKLKESMLKIGYSLNETANVNDLLQLILEDVINCMDDRNSGLVLLLEEDKNLKIVAVKGYDLEKIKRFSIKLKEYYELFNDGDNINKTVIINNIDKIRDINKIDETKEIKSIISSPIIIDDELYGFLNINSMYNNFFNEGDLELMEYMRNQVSIAITKRKFYEKTIYLSRYDKLTNVYNRSHFEQLLNDTIYNNDIVKKEFFVAVFDLNKLKKANDNYGHLAGDELIKTFARGLQSLCGDSDIIGRFGGDEFVGVFFNVDSNTLVSRFEGLIEHFRNNPIVIVGNKIVCSYSYGFVEFPREGMEFDELIKLADKRMYEYKYMLKK